MGAYFFILFTKDDKYEWRGKLSEESKEKMRCAALERFNGINGEKERRRLSKAMSDSAKKTIIICIETN